MRKLLFIMSVLILCGCVKEDGADTVHSGRKVNVHMDFTVDADFTRSVNDPDVVTDAKSVIRNLWIIQYNGVSDDSQILGEPTYIEDFSTFDGNVQLLATDKPTMVCFVANTFEGVGEFPVHQRTTLADLKTYRRVIRKETDLLGAETSDSHHVIYNGYLSLDRLDEESASQTVLSAVLKRNISKVSVTVNNNSSGEVRILSMQICSVPSVSYYMSNPSTVASPYPAVTAFNQVNYDQVQWPAGASSMSLKAYLPVNMRGTSMSESQSDKNKYAPSGATYLLVSAVYLDDGQEYPITYSFFLGSDMVKDYNLAPNRSYTYTFDINSKGNADSDNRVTDWGYVDFTDTEKYPLSNSYILNPMPSGDMVRHFRIPIRRITDFWGSAGYENSPYEALEQGNKSWRCFVLASDFVITEDNFRLVKSNGVNGVDGYFEVAVAPGVKGNVIVAVGPAIDNAYTVSWSWHLWITDYDPYPALNYGNGKEGEYIYPVTNGSVHRYAGTYWKNNLSKYIMDRNLGSVSVYDYPADNRGFLYFQYGRKDPFFAKADIYKYPDGNHYTFQKKKYSEANVENAVRYAVKNPLTFVNPSEGKWAAQSTYNSVSSRWFDHKSDAGQKSVFDPCPPGYRLPDKNVWSDFSRTVNKETTNVQWDADLKDSKMPARGFGLFSLIKGLQYWPYGDGSDIPADVVYFPANGYLNSGDLTHHGNLPYTGEIGGANEYWCFLWADSASTEANAYGFTAQPDHMAASNTANQVRGCPVRCITDN